MLYRLLSRDVVYQSLNMGGKYGSKTLIFEEKKNEVLGADFSHCNCTVFISNIRYCATLFPPFFVEETEIM